MAFKDRLVYCETARRSFFDTVREQRARADRGEGEDAPVYCSICRAQVHLAAVPADEHAEEGDIAISALVREGCAFGAVEIGGGATSTADQGASAARRGGERRGSGSPAGREAESSEPSRRRSRGGRKRGGHKRGGDRRGGAGRGRGRDRGRGRREAPRQTDLRIRHVGTVKWFNPDKGYGFIAQDDGSDVFVHSSSVLGAQESELYEGLPVEYEVEAAPRGQQAVYVVPLA